MNYEKVTNELKKGGASHVSSFLDNTILDKIETELDAVFAKIPITREAILSGPNVLKIENAKNSNYSGGKHCRVMPDAYSTHFPSLVSVFTTDEFKRIVGSYLGEPNQFCMQIFCSEDSAVIKDEALCWRGGQLHWDPYASLKFLLYLTDADENTGASHIIPNTRELGREYRQHKMDIRKHDGLFGGCKHRLEDFSSTPEYTKSDALPVICKRGDLVLLDTDVLHYGGVMRKPGRRKVILVHNRPLLKNPAYLTAA
jgi:hypothetical protein